MDAEKVPVDAFLPSLRILSEKGLRLTLVAGQAVNLWAERYLQDEPELGSLVPFTSRDIDLLGSADDIYRIPTILEGDLKRYSDVRTPLFCVFIQDSDPPLHFELLRGIHGPVSNERIEDRSKQVGFIRAIDPLSLLIAKCYNLANLDQEGRQDLRHVRIMVLVARAYLRDGLKNVNKAMSERQFIRELRVLTDLANDRSFQKGLQMAEKSLLDCLPIAEITAMENEFPSVARFHEGTISKIRG